MSVSGTDYRYAQDFRGTLDSVLLGQCPCWQSTSVPDIDPCSDNGGQYFVRIYRADPTRDDVCTGATLEVSNGFYDYGG